VDTNMSQKRKMKVTIEEMFGWTKAQTSKTPNHM
jgi:hypothetical protein